MSQQPISRSPDLKRLRDEGFEIEIRSGYLLTKGIPYLTDVGKVERGTLVCALTLAGDIAQPPADHVASFAGGIPHEPDRKKFRQIVGGAQTLAEDLHCDCSFSSKPEAGVYADFYVKVTTYAGIFESHAHTVDPTVTSRTFRPTAVREEESVFCYVDTSSSRSDIVAATEKLQLQDVAIVGVGGTGSYILDLISKCPVRAIHIFDDDQFLSHNAFRSPGAASIEELEALPTKVGYFADRYSQMHRHVFPHEQHIDGANVEILKGMSFVFLCLDRGCSKRNIISSLEEWGIPFIDVGMGVERAHDGTLMAILRITTSTPEMRSHVWEHSRIPLMDGADNDEYAKNIQIAELNALNAALAVIKWKKLCGFYFDQEREHHSTFATSGNQLENEDRSG